MERLIMKLNMVFLLGALVLLGAACDKSMLSPENQAQGYRYNILTENDYQGSKLEQWITTCNASDGYYEFISSDPDSWDLYIYYPGLNKALSSEVHLKVEEGILKVYVQEDASSKDSVVAKNLVLHVAAPTRGVWPSASELYLNNKQLACVRKDYQD